MKKLLFALGCALLALNAWGLTRTLRSPHIAEARSNPADLRISHEQLLSQIARRPNEADRAYIHRLTFALSDGIAHYWGDDVDRFHLRVPVWENYLLYAASFVWPAAYRKYEFAGVDRAIERGVGLCSQQSIVLARLLQREGIDAQLQGLQGHVVVRTRDASGTTYLADPDYRVVIPYDAATVERRPEIVRPYYEAAGLDRRLTDSLVSIYGPDGNREWTIGQYFYGKFHHAERAAYLLKWLIPLLLALPYLFSLRAARGAAIVHRNVAPGPSQAWWGR